jgi:hypothetical protein
LSTFALESGKNESQKIRQIESKRIKQQKDGDKCIKNERKKMKNVMQKRGKGERKQGQVEEKSVRRNRFT